MRRVALIALVAAIVFGAAPSARADWIWAQSVAAVGTDSVILDPSRTDPTAALGAPDGNFYSLGVDTADPGNLGGWIALDFGTIFQGVSVVFEVTFNCGANAAPGCANYVEAVKVYGSSAPLPAFTPNSGNVGAGWTFIADIFNDDAQSGKVLMNIGGPFRYLLLADKSAYLGQPGTSGDGFDLDAVGVVPEPASMLLLGTGLVGLAGAARRRLRK